MAKLSRRITKAVYDKLSKEMKENYVVNDDDDDEYILELDEADDDNPDALRRARDREKQRGKTTADELKKAKDRIAELENGGSGDGDGDGEGDPEPPRNKKRKAKDIQTLDAAWKEKYAALESERDEKLSAKDAYIKKTMIQNAANTMAAKISTAPKLLAKAILERLDVDFDDDEPRLVVLDADGKASSTLTLDKLEKEFSSNKEYASIIIGTKASGGGAPRNGPDQRPARGGASEGTDLSKLPSKELVAHLRSIKEAS